MKTLLIFAAIIIVLSQASGCWLRSHGRGAGKVLTTCPPDQDKNGALCYPRCRKGYRGVGPVCWKFPKSYTRGAGHPLGCASGLEKSGALCYPKCSAGYHGIGPVCWGSCPAGYAKCGALCLQGKSCAGTIGKMAKDIFTSVGKIAISAAGGSAGNLVQSAIKGAGTVAKDFIYPICH